MVLSFFYKKLHHTDLKFKSAINMEVRREIDLSDVLFVWETHGTKVHFAQYNSFNPTFLRKSGWIFSSTYIDIDTYQII